MADGKPSRRPSLSSVKRPLSAFMMFSREKRKEIHDKEKLTLGESTKILSQRWKEMTEEEKRPFVEQSMEDRQRYRDEVIADKAKGKIQSRKRTSSASQLDNGKPLKRRREDFHADMAEGKASESTMHNDTMRPISLQNYHLPGVGVAVFTDNFLQHNKKLNSELMKLRQLKKNMIDQKQRLEDTIQAIDTDIKRVDKLVEKQVQENDKLEMELQIVRKVVADVMGVAAHSDELLTSENILDRLLSGPAPPAAVGNRTIKSLIDSLYKTLPHLKT